MKWGVLSLVLIGGLIIVIGATGSQKKVCQTVFGGNCNWIPGTSLHETTCTSSTTAGPGNCGNTQSSSSPTNVDNFFNGTISGTTSEGQISSPIGTLGGTRI